MPIPPLTLTHGPLITAQRWQWGKAPEPDKSFRSDGPAGITTNMLVGFTYMTWYDAKGRLLDIARRNDGTPTLVRRNNG